MIVPEPKKRGRKPGSKNSPDGPKSINISVTDSRIITMIAEYCDELQIELGFRPTITQAVLYLLTNRKKSS